MRACRDERLREGRPGPFHGLQAHGTDDIRCLRQAPGIRRSQRADARHQLRPVEQRQALLGLEREWLETRAGQRCGPRHDAAAYLGFALADRNQREVRERCEVAGGTHAAARRDNGVDSGVQHPAQQLRHGHANSR